jgi:hypothetical protein
VLDFRASLVLWTGWSWPETGRCKLSVALRLAQARVRMVADESGIQAARMLSPLMDRAQRAKMERALERAGGRWSENRFEELYGPEMVRERERVQRENREWLRRRRERQKGDDN